MAAQVIVAVWLSPEKRQRYYYSRELCKVNPFFFFFLEKFTEGHFCA
jgi:hypothetical protein